MTKALKSFSWWWQLSLWLVLLVVFFVVVPSGAAIANERSDWSNELAILKICMLRQLSYTSTLLELLDRQELSLIEFGLQIEELEKLQQSSRLRISDLEKQLASSQYSTENLQLELAKLQDLQEQSRQKHEELLISWKGYRQEAEKQIEELQGERDRARRWIWITGLVGAGLGALLASIF